MADFTGSTTVDAPQEALFEFLSDVGNLPRYFARMTSAEHVDGDRVHTTATLPDGTKVEGQAWFTVDPATQHIAWGAEGSSEYHGTLDVSGTETGSQVQVHLHTTRVDSDNDQVSDGIDRTLASIKLLVEKQDVMS
ncbi:SRPBCC family protein [Actinomycetospora endophytica]|uniref:SRPBCC family protein n=1 Tax=Actinomycetospora endophytica TaxID=2291215 RepID=A0ABS8PC98_9PSEU|nr:SRPBCC family protein [Actinomycetospora endophytica]MCD2195882.1 SRPBCC family protein [Actinomycetospora endophytica]